MAEEEDILALEEYDRQEEARRAVEAPPIVSLKTYEDYKEDDLPVHVACEDGARPEEIALRLIEECPEASSRREPAGMLPLHLACQHNAPTAVCLARIEQYPEAARMKDTEEDGGEEAAENEEDGGSGQLPIHYASACPAHKDVILKLAELYPESLLIKDNEGALPVHYAQRSRRSKVLWRRLADMCPKSVEVENPLDEDFFAFEEEEAEELREQAEYRKTVVNEEEEARRKAAEEEAERRRGAQRIAEFVLQKFAGHYQGQYQQRVTNQGRVHEAAEGTAWLVITAPEPDTKLMNLRKRFRQYSEDAIRRVLEEDGGHAGKAAYRLKEGMEVPEDAGPAAFKGWPAQYEITLSPEHYDEGSCIGKDRTIKLWKGHAVPVVEGRAVTGLVLQADSRDEHFDGFDDTGKKDEREVACSANEDQITFSIEHQDSLLQSGKVVAVVAAECGGLIVGKQSRLRKLSHDEELRERVKFAKYTWQERTAT